MAETGSDVVLDCGDFFVKLTAPAWAAELAVEAAMLRRLQAARRVLPFLVPRVLGAGELSGWPYVVIGRVPGRSIDAVWPGLDHAARVALARRLGELVRALHEVPVPDGASAEWPAFIQRMVAVAVERERKRGVDERWLAQIPGFVATHLGMAQPPGPLCWLHTELLGDHIRLSEQDGEWRPVALLDFADSCVGDPRYELPALAEFVFKGETGCWDAFVDGYGRPICAASGGRAGEWMAWSLVHQFGSLQRGLRAVGSPVPEQLSELAMRLYR